jgi:hypothetical protein
VTELIEVIDYKNRLTRKKLIVLEGDRDDEWAFYQSLPERGLALPVPMHGWRFPLANADDFNWALIGAKPIDDPQNDGETAIMHLGFLYRRREHPKSRFMGEAIRYSRGAKATDVSFEPTTEGVGRGYVTLVRFEGPGRDVKLSIGYKTGRG